MNMIDATSKTYPTLSMAERDRRWAAVRAMLKSQGLTGAVAFGNGRDPADGYLANETKRAIIFLPVEGDPVAFHGDVPLDRYDVPGQRWERWIPDWIAGNGVANLTKYLSDNGFADAKLGVVGLTSRMVGEWQGVIAYNIWTRVQELLPEVEWTDVTHEFQNIEVLKSAEEQVLLRKAAALGEDACNAFVEAARSGCNEHEVMAAAVHAIIAGGGWIRTPMFLERAGSSMFAWQPPEWLAMGGAPHVLTRGDTIAAEIFAFYGGMETQQQIDVSIGEPSALLRELEAVCIESYDAGMQALKPGMRFSELCEIMEEPLHRTKTWNTGPMVQTVAPIYNSATRINPGVDAALSHLPQLPHGHGLDGDFVIQAGHALAFEPNALRDGQRVCIGGTVLVGETGGEDLNSTALRLNVV